MPRAVQMLDRLMMTHPMMTDTQMMPTSLILFSRFFMTIGYFSLIGLRMYSLCSTGIRAVFSSASKDANSSWKACT